MFAKVNPRNPHDDLSTLSKIAKNYFVKIIVKLPMADHLVKRLL